jgi:hypothetical protein
MSGQTEFVLRNDGFYWAPPIDPDDHLDYVMDMGFALKDDTIDSVLLVTGKNITVESHTNTATTVTIWVKDGIVRKVAEVMFRIRTVGGRTFDRTFKIDVQQQ